LSNEFVEQLCKEYEGTVYYKRYIEGLWALAEGLIYPMYENCFAEITGGPAQEYCLSIDYGTMNAFAAILWAKYGTIWYGLKNYYYSGRDLGEQKTDEEYAEALDEFVGSLTDLETIIDPSAASFIALLRKRKGKYRVKKANNDVADGLRETAVALKTGMIKISPTMKEWKDEVEGYVWDPKSIVEQPLKEKDHLMDAMRYFVKTKRIANSILDYTSPFGG
jgi:PBSX family phage terminase large subunit